MSKLEKADKDKILKKRLKIEQKGLLSFKAYLITEYAESTERKTKKKLTRYIEDQVVETEKKLEKIRKKLKDLKS